MNMQSAVTRNNRGIAFLEKGVHEEALLEFKAAAQLMYSFTQELKKKHLNDSAESDCGSQEDQPRESFTECIPSERTIYTENSFICSTPIIMLNSDEPSTACTIESASILLNMALCYHLNSMRTNPMQGVLQNAINLYEMAYGLAIQVHEDVRSQKIIMTALNNLGQLNYELGEFETAQLYLNDLSTYINYLGEDVEKAVLGDLHECMLNCLVLKNPHAGAAAA
mmetsp:Transcript_21395/g.35402  ORF Transcript_21395/g.35402 Transcript_21395/m.35402 type:complete len:224 (-) Transcript_21395:80-751(-)|eukprot:CAMPEP_0119005236 /NCGR_PEP_ID=MMETSP1176-20130426/1601_1 /TAXON_ID=265551 /ORGANISM="Synedropsis recta cf, Strain CCMP1620" /LENGTH=223 /DNA_ID=CAMNT_0006957019 /DNA_START=95 /DNA_END=766 /DNA_ORIENTATION=-